MRSLRYLNVVLTLIAVLLTLNLWTAWAVSPMSLASPAQAMGIPDAGAQRQEIVDLLKQMNHKIEELTGLLKTGQARVQVENASKDSGKGG